ncbi:MAG: twin-arginine translocase TatA/TatE family subunit [Bacteroidetes bacterium]|nr:twin-arginine translocase TatA/TatE family subunit [Bacteroidota bacterium]
MSLAILLGMLGPTEIILIVLVVLLLFGGRKIPELMRGLGRGIKEFKDGMNSDSPGKGDNTKTEK